MIPKAVVRLLDEVNVFIQQKTSDGKLQKLDPVTIKRCRAVLRFVNPAAKYSTKGRLFGWKGDEYYFDEYGRTFFNVLDRVIPIIEEQGYDIEILDERAKTPEIDLSPIDNTFMSDVLWPDGHRFEGQPVILSDTQVESINKFFEEPQQLAELATGFGKTLTCAALARKIVQSGYRMMIIVPDTGLVLQTVGTLLQMGIDAGAWYGAKKEVDKDVVVATWQSLNSLTKKKDTKTKNELSQQQLSALLNNMKALISDECHGLRAGVLFNLMKTTLKDIYIRWGLTGTIPLEERERIKLIISIGPIYQEVDSAELQDIGFLAKCDIKVLQLQDQRKFTDYPAERKAITSDPNRYIFWSRTIEAITCTGNTLVLVDNKAPGYALEEEIKAQGYERVIFVSGDMAADERKEYYEKVNAGDDWIIVATTAVASTGIDIPRLHNLVIIEIGKAFTKVVQSIGRSLRKSFDKDYAEIFDFCSSLKYSAKHAKERQKFYKIKKFPFEVIKISDWQDI